MQPQEFVKWMEKANTFLISNSYQLLFYVNDVIDIGSINDAKF